MNSGVSDLTIEEDAKENEADIDEGLPIFPYEQLKTSSTDPVTEIDITKREVSHNVIVKRTSIRASVAKAHFSSFWTFNLFLFQNFPGCRTKQFGVNFGCRFSIEFILYPRDGEGCLVYSSYNNSAIENGSYLVSSEDEVFFIHLIISLSNKIIKGSNIIVICERNCEIIEMFVTFQEIYEKCTSYLKHQQ